MARNHESRLKRMEDALGAPGAPIFLPVLVAAGETKEAALERDLSARGTTRDQVAQVLYVGPEIEAAFESEDLIRGADKMNLPGRAEFLEAFIQGIRNAGGQRLSEMLKDRSEAGMGECVDAGNQTTEEI